jgi:hypothetical protein
MSDRLSQGNVLVSNEWAKRYGSEGIVCSALKPGMIYSELYVLHRCHRWSTNYPVVNVTLAVLLCSSLLVSCLSA